MNRFVGIGFRKDLYSNVARLFLMLLMCVPAVASAQTPAASSTVPTLVNFTGTIVDIHGHPWSGVHGVTFYLYKDSEGGAPLWIETQNVQADSSGHYSVMLGSTTSQGLPKDLFSTGEARWLAVQTEGQAEQPRVLLLSVPYALKAADAETIGGLPPSAFMLAAPTSTTSVSAGDSTQSPATTAPPPAGTVTGSGTLDFVPLWTSTSAIGNSVLFQTGSGSTARVGINTTTPGATLDVKGTTNLEGLLTSPATGPATSTAGKSSQAHSFVASSFNSTTSSAVNQTFQWKAEASGNNTAAPSGTLNLLFGSGKTAPAETGLKLSSQGIFTFATGQTFPGTGTITGVTTATGSGLTGGGTSGSLSLSLATTCATSQVLQWNGSSWACTTLSSGGTITGVTAGTDLTGGGTSGKVTLNLDTTKVPQLAAANTFVGNQSVTGDLTVSNGVSVTGDSFMTTSDGLAGLQVSQGGTNGSGAIVGISHSNLASSATILGTALSTTGQVFGVEGTAQNEIAVGVYGVDGTRSATGALFFGASQNGSGVWADGGNDGRQAILATSDFVPALVAANNSTIQPAIIGFNNSTSSIGLGTWGVTYSPAGIGVLGTSAQTSNNYQHHVGGQPFGVVGDAADNASSVGFPIGVWGVADSGYAVVGENISSSVAAGAFLNVSDVPGNPALLAGSDIGSCTIDGAGDMGCTGLITGQLPAQGGARRVSLYAMQSPENWFEDFGSGRLSNGSAIITLDPAFAETVNTSADYKVFPVPNGDCKGLYIAEKTASGFVVRELGGGRSNTAFDYRIVAKRKGFENVRMEDVTERQSKLAASIRQLTKPNTAKTSPLPSLPNLRRSTPLHTNQAPAPAVQKALVMRTVR